jgi:hypothetical protein
VPGGWEDGWSKSLDRPSAWIWIRLAWIRLVAFLVSERDSSSREEGEGLAGGWFGRSMVIVR